MKKKQQEKPLIAALLALSIIGRGQAQPARLPFPQVTGETLSGKQISLPGSISGRAVIVSVGFSRESQGHLKNWIDQVRKRFGKDGIAIYSIAVLEGAPRFVRPMAVHGMKSGTPEAERDRFVVVYSKERELKQATQFVSPSDAYILLLDKTGNIAWRFRGDVSPAAMDDLGHQIQALSSGSSR